jgi:hypothetical protein
MGTYPHVMPDMHQGASDKLERCYSPKLAQNKVKNFRRATIGIQKKVSTITPMPGVRSSTVRVSGQRQTYGSENKKGKFAQC